MKTASKENNYHYNKALKENASRLRKDMTKAEACLWKYVLQSGKLSDYQFKRQRPVLNYIADFMCPRLMLIIEVDGITHLDEDVIKHDENRQNELEQAGFTVIRFHDSEVLNDIQNVERILESYIDEFESGK